ncbi:hypothetical protein CRE_12045 [Caenorhabditis remanei]|uniref:Uncharacterized protein n=1 Tax=Caenorhabditis remanei TaxID=31234 RepID=E3MPY7_CAERE|nr:hypothetical protein CRE_12045 [Caenorhabditis remanei]
MTGSDEPAEPEEDQKFDKGIEFLLSCLGMSVGLGNLWRFPTRAYENGGSVFLIPYLICALLFGLPGVYLEFALGQYQGKSPPFVYRRIMPVLEGFGWVAALLMATVGVYFMLIISWISVYLFNVVIGNSGKWGRCDNKWNDAATCFNIPAQELCSGAHPAGWNTSDTPIQKLIYMNGSCHDKEDYENITLVSASAQYFQNFIVRPSTSLTDFNSINWPVFIAMIIGWVITVLSIWRGMKFVGKLSYVTVGLPYIIVTILFVRGVTLEGAGDGLRFFFAGSDFSALWNYNTWTAALTQMCFSLSIGFGGLMNIASYNRRKHNCYRDAIYLIIGDTAMSLIGGAAVFSTLGFLARKRGVDISEVVASGPDLAFSAYPDAMNQMPVPWLWNFLFFVMLWLLGISSEFVMVELVCSCLRDRFPEFCERRIMVVGGVSAILFVFGIVLTTDAGIYWFELFDEYGAGLGAVVSATSMCVIIAYLYGLEHFKFDLNLMLGAGGGCCSIFLGHNSPYFRVNWKWISPVFGVILIVLSCWKSYPHHNDPVAYPVLFDILGWTLAITPFTMIPLCAFLAYRNFKKHDIPTRGLFLVQKQHPSYQRISSDWSPERKRIGLRLPCHEPGDQVAVSLSTLHSVNKNSDLESI